MSEWEPQPKYISLQIETGPEVCIYQIEEVEDPVEMPLKYFYQDFSDCFLPLKHFQQNNILLSIKLIFSYFVT